MHTQQNGCLSTTTGRLTGVYLRKFWLLYVWKKLALNFPGPTCQLYWSVEPRNTYVPLAFIIIIFQLVM